MQELAQLQEHVNKYLLISEVQCAVQVQRVAAHQPHLYEQAVAFRPRVVVELLLVVLAHDLVDENQILRLQHVALVLPLVQVYALYRVPLVVQLRGGLVHATVRALAQLAQYRVVGVQGDVFLVEVFVL